MVDTLLWGGSGRWPVWVRLSPSARNGATEIQPLRFFVLKPGQRIIRTSSCRWIAEQRHSPRRIAKHLSKAGLCRWQRNFVTRFLQKNLVSICVIAFDVNFIEDRKSVAIGNFWTNEHPDKPKNIHITYWYPIDYTDLKQSVNMLITLFFLWEWAYSKTSLKLYNNLRFNKLQVLLWLWRYAHWFENITASRYNKIRNNRRRPASCRLRCRVSGKDWQGIIRCRAGQPLVAG